MQRVLELVPLVRDETGLNVAVSAGILTEEQARRLADGGVHRYNHNLETARSLLRPRSSPPTPGRSGPTPAGSCASHGMELCCGVLLGMGETVDAAPRAARRAAGGRPGRGAGQLPQPAARARRSATGRWPSRSRRSAGSRCSASRCPAVILRYAGGREVTLRDLQVMGMTSGINALIVGNYLTTLGRSPAEDLQMLADLRMPVGVLGQRSERVVDGRRSLHGLRPAPSPSAPGAAESSTRPASAPSVGPAWRSASRPAGWRARCKRARRPRRRRWPRVRSRLADGRAEVVALAGVLLEVGPGCRPTPWLAWIDYAEAVLADRRRRAVGDGPTDETLVRRLTSPPRCHAPVRRVPAGLASDRRVDASRFRLSEQLRASSRRSRTYLARTPSSSATRAGAIRSARCSDRADIAAMTSGAAVFNRPPRPERSSGR